MTNRLMDVVIKGEQWMDRHKRLLLALGLLAIGLTLVLMPDALWAVDTIEDSVDKVTDLFKGKLFKMSITVMTIVGTIYAGMKHSFGAAMSVLVIAIILSMFLGWLHGTAEPFKAIFK